MSHTRVPRPCIISTALDGRGLGVRPDLIIEWRRDILEETDGPMLLHGLRETRARKLVVLVGARRALAIAVRTDKTEMRFTAPKGPL